MGIRAGKEWVMEIRGVCGHQKRESCGAAKDGKKKSLAEHQPGIFTTLYLEIGH
ncbi:hypothetical protein [Bacillus sp. OV322]|uniref:hypothetical protein n=1 Tax=Bacillus sp. OV322 TaxID=1882764 RepID=UPI0015A5DEA2|nr:hypothetical protein [Bacillus sp. OV322]